MALGDTIKACLGPKDGVTDHTAPSQQMLASGAESSGIGEKGANRGRMERLPISGRGEIIGGLFV